MGTGQFRPGDAANPHIGDVGKVEEVSEMRIETLCVGEETVRGAVQALKKSVHILPISYHQAANSNESTSIRRAGLSCHQDRRLLKSGRLL